MGMTNKKWVFGFLVVAAILVVGYAIADYEMKVFRYLEDFCEGKEGVYETKYGFVNCSNFPCCVLWNTSLSECWRCSFGRAM
ncbi:hypothetical protein DRJ16_00115 [Candidatus Woesearchaeota archaeon]|nr:MAG: hypothetical protein DRJ16_00115 [Candidatus Woesearchaeota archaeon]